MKLRDKAHDRFVQHLLDKKLVPGQFVSQRELVALTRLPLGAIRELIPRVEAEGLIVTVPRRGMQIAKLDVTMLRNVFQLLMLLEKEGVQQFTRRALDDEVERLDQELGLLVQAAELKQATRALLDKVDSFYWAFHQTLVESLKNGVVSDVYRVNSIRLRLHQGTFSAETLSALLQEHTPIMVAIRARDACAAAEAIQQHLANAYRRALGLDVASIGEAPSDGSSASEESAIVPLQRDTFAHRAVQSRRTG